MTRAVIFDMDGLLLDSEVYWEEARRTFCRSLGCDWRPEDELGVKGFNSREWAEAITRRCRPDESPAAIIAAVTAAMRALYEERLPLLPGAVESVRLAAELYPLAVASSSPPDLIGYVIAAAGLSRYFAALVSADGTRGKPAPDVFLAAASRLQSPPEEITVLEDSGAGILAGKAAGMRVIAVPNAHYPPPADALAQADLVLTSLVELRPQMLG